jgi:hypothetical protein
MCIKLMFTPPPPPTTTTTTTTTTATTGELRQPVPVRGHARLLHPREPRRPQPRGRTRAAGGAGHPLRQQASQLHRQMRAGIA